MVFLEVQNKSLFNLWYKKSLVFIIDLYSSSCWIVHDGLYDTFLHLHFGVFEDSRSEFADHADIVSSWVDMGGFVCVCFCSVAYFLKKREVVFSFDYIQDIHLAYSGCKFLCKLDGRSVGILDHSYS